MAVAMRWHWQKDKGDIMKEIKFRAWDKKNQKWYDKIIEWAFDRPKYSIGQLPELPENVIFMQYTGLKDKINAEIYEGDVLLSTENFGTEQYPDERRIMEAVEYKCGAFYPLCEVPSRAFEIIGNIYENPELVKVK